MSIGDDGGREQRLREALRHGAEGAGADRVDPDRVAARGAGIRRARRSAVALGVAGVLAIAGLGGVVWSTLPGTGSATLADRATADGAREESADLATGSGAAGSAAAGPDAACSARGLPAAVGVALEAAVDEAAVGGAVTGEVVVRNETGATLSTTAELRVELLDAQGAVVAAGIAETYPLSLDAGASRSLPLVASPVPCGDTGADAATRVRAVAVLAPGDGDAAVRVESVAEPLPDR
ncbi:FxLYD domain-containing protein [Agromyces sp. SYSU T00194]|uniref:FxLYD domain-containing protein n=1 Tax=Agromyces chitinivorans TaxID=3158560 RepID=UPI003394D935